MYLFSHFNFFLQPFFFRCFVLLSRLDNVRQLLLQSRDDREDHHNSNIFFTLNKMSTATEQQRTLYVHHFALAC